MPLYLLFRFLFSLLPDFTIWSIFHKNMFHCVVDFSFVDIPLLIIGYAIVWPALSRIGMAFHFLKKARRKGQKKPQFVVDDGPFGVSRHPINAGRIILILGFCTTMNNGFAFILAILISIMWLVNAYLDEKKMLKDYYPQEYRDYKKEVTSFMFDKLDWILVIVLLVINCVGLLI